MATGKGRKGRRSSMQGLEPLADVLLRASPESKARGPTPMHLWVWQEAVGPRIARRARPVRLERGVLTIRVATSVWAQELTFLAPTLVAQLVSVGIDVQSVRFCVGPVETLPEPAAPRPVSAPPSAPSASRELTRTIAKVDDIDLRSTIARAAAANLAWQAGAPQAAGPSSRARTVAARPSTSATQAARAPQSAARETAGPARTHPTTRAVPRGKP
jgi:hypothetical protein